MAGRNKVKVAILGASGYTGAELLRLLVRHPETEIVALSADRRANQPIEAVFPHLGGLGLPVLKAVEDIAWPGIDVAFCALPHGTTQSIVAGLPMHLKVVDLSADFRLADTATYAEWYGHPHQAPALQKDAVYGLTEIAREAIRPARLVANPGCYPTAALLPLVPLIASEQIDADDVIIDAKSGVSGAGRGLKETSLFCEVAEGFEAYAIARHRHGPEIEQMLSRTAGRAIRVNFTPHLAPMNRGVLASIYVRLKGDAKPHDLRATLSRHYAGEPFIRVLPEGTAPATRHVRGSNHCLIGVFADRIKGRAIVISAIDNMVKGASGQAVQNMNLVLGLPETTALEQAPLFP